MVGAGALAVAAVVAGTAAAGVTLIGAALTIATVVHLLMLLLEYSGRHATAACGRGRPHGHPRPVRTGRSGGGAVGLAVRRCCTCRGRLGRHPVLAAALAGLAVQVALLTYESVFVRAGQDVPLS